MKHSHLALLILALLSACSPNLPPQKPSSASDAQAASAASAAAASSPQVASDVLQAASLAGAASGVAKMASGASQTVTSLPQAASQTPQATSAPASASAASSPTPPNATAHKGKKIPIGGSDEFGNTVFYFPASIQKHGKLYHVMTENRYKKPQPLPESGKLFLYSLIKEAVDCERKLTDPIAVTHFSDKDQVVEKHEFPYPDYSKWTPLELQSLSDEHPDRAFINAVCHQKK